MTASDMSAHGLIPWHGTTIIGVRRDGRTIIAGDGQVSMGNTVMKPNAREKKLEQHGGQLLRAAVELTKDWRTDKYLRNLEALMIVADADNLLVLTGNGDVLEPEERGGTVIAAIGSGGNYALAAARAISDYETDPELIATKAMQVAADVCVFTNDRVTVETV
ncbi:MAG: ATP-dependent protease subunit HslV [Pelagerythrobacter marensis]|nr:MAG: ATP-dependent protease subunit HslV [Pelagerythrobacter marensis]